MNSGSLACSMAITAGNGFAGGGESAGTVAGATLVAGGPAFAVGVFSDRIAGAGCSAGGSVVLSVTGSAATVGSITPGGDAANGAGANGGGDVMTGFASTSGAGASMTRRSGTSPRRSCQGKAKPGSPNSWPPKLRLNSNAWSSRENSNGRKSRRPWRLWRRSGCWPGPAGFSPAARSADGLIFMHLLCGQNEAGCNETVLARHDCRRCKSVMYAGAPTVRMTFATVSH